MKRQKKAPSWQAYGLTAALWALAVLVRVWGMVRQGRAGGWDVPLVLLFLVNAVVFSVRAVRTFREQESDKIISANDYMIDGGTTHE